MDKPIDEPTTPIDLAGALRTLRRRADMSQRELAAASGVPAATVGRIEAGAANPAWRTVERLVCATGARLAVLDADGTEPGPARTDGWRDQAARRFPAHLDPKPETVWDRGRTWDVIGFIRNRGLRDQIRRERAGECRGYLLTDIRRLGPRDAAVLATLRTEAAAFDLAGRPTPAPAPPPPSDQEALRYLRDPSLRHWIADDAGRVLGHLVAHVHQRHTGRPALVVTDLGLRQEHRVGPVGPLLAATLCDEAARLDVGEITALASDPAVATSLRVLGFTARPKRPLLLTLGE